jgi:hypothetical protein
MKALLAVALALTLTGCALFEEPYRCKTKEECERDAASVPYLLKPFEVDLDEGGIKGQKLDRHVIRGSKGGGYERKE